MRLYRSQGNKNVRTFLHKQSFRLKCFQNKKYPFHVSFLLGKKLKSFFFYKNAAKGIFTKFISKSMCMAFDAVDQRRLEVTGACHAKYSHYTNIGQIWKNHNFLVENTAQQLNYWHWLTQKSQKPTVVSIKV